MRYHKDKLKIQKSKFKITKNGSILVEVLVGAAIALVVFLALANIWPTVLSLSNHNLRTSQAEFLLEEGWEGMLYRRAAGWASKIATLTTGQSYRLAFGPTGWQSTTSPALIDGIFDRQVTLAPVYRDAASNIAGSGTLDPGARQVTITVGWLDHGATTSVSTSGYLTNLFGN